MNTKWHIKFKDGQRMIIGKAATCSQAVAFAAFERAARGAVSYHELTAESVTKTEEIEIPTEAHDE